MEACSNGVSFAQDWQIDSRGITHKDDLEQHLLVNLHELLVPLLDVGGLLAGIGVVIGGGWGISSVMLAPLDNLLEDGLIDLREAVSDFSSRRWCFGSEREG